MSEDLHNNPPFQISQSELGPENNTDVKTYKTGGKYAVCFYCRTTKTPCTCSFLNKSTAAYWQFIYSQATCIQIFHI